MLHRGTRGTVFINLFWKLVERGATHGIQFVIQIILARLLLPKDYGLIAITVIFINFGTLLVQSGLNTALIQKKNIDEKDLSSVLYLSLFISSILYIIIYFIAPLIANFYNEPQIVLLLRVLSINLFFGAFNSIQVAIISRNMEFKKLFFSSIGGILVSGAIGITMAYMGYGVWALVAQQVIFKLLIVLILLLTVKWKPILSFSINRVKKLFSFGWKILVSSIIYDLYNDLRTLIIGKIYTPTMLGFYNRGFQFPDLIVNNISGSIEAVMFPAFVLQQDNKTRLKSMVQRSIVTSSFLVFPVMVGLAVVAEPLVKIVLTDKWLPSVPFIRIFCAAFALRPLNAANQQVVNALGRSDITLKLNIIKRMIEFIILGVTVFWGIYAIALGGVLSSLLGTVINAYPNKELLNYRYKDQLKDVAPIFALSLIMGLVIYSINLIVMPTWKILLLQITAGIFIYFGLAIILKLECYIYLVTTINELFTEKSSSGT